MHDIRKLDIIEIALSMGFRLDHDRWESSTGPYMRFELKEELDEKDLRWIWYKHEDFAYNMKNGANILFKAGQKAYRQKLNEYVEL